MDERTEGRTHGRMGGRTDGRTWATLNALPHSTNGGGIKMKSKTSSNVKKVHKEKVTIVKAHVTLTT